MKKHIENPASDFTDQFPRNYVTVFDPTAILKKPYRTLKTKTMIDFMHHPSDMDIRECILLSNGPRPFRDWYVLKARHFGRIMTFEAGTRHAIFTGDIFKRLGINSNSIVRQEVDRLKKLMTAWADVRKTCLHGVGMTVPPTTTYSTFRLYFQDEADAVVAAMKLPEWEASMS